MTETPRPLQIQPGPESPARDRTLARLRVGLALAGAAAVILMSTLDGGTWPVRLFPIAVYAFVFSALVFLTRRLFFSAIVAAAVPLTIFIISRIKLHFLGLPFLFFDVAYLLRSNFLELMLNDVLIGLATCLAAVALLGLSFGSWKSDRISEASHRAAAWSLVAAAVLAFISIPAVTRFDEWDLTAWNHKVPTFFVSMTRMGGQLEPRPADIEPPGKSTGGTIAPTVGRLPDLIVVLEESTFDVRDLLAAPAARDAALTEFFGPSGGRSGRLKVHTFGGQTWLAEFAFLTGIPHTAFGTNGVYAPFILEGRIKSSLPQYLKRLGYKTLALYPSPGSFVNARRFYSSVGFDRFLDPSDLKPPRSWTWRTPDSEILQAAIETLKSQLASADQPVFLMTLTLNQHGPHRGTPEGEQAASAFSAGSVSPEHSAAFGEYLVRLRHSAAAMNEFIAQYRAAFPGRAAVVLHFGDHHPVISRESRLADRTGDVRALTDDLMRTYFSIVPVNFALSPLSVGPFEMLDIALLPAVLLESAGLPSDELWTLRAELAKECAGRYEECRSPRKLELHGYLLSKGPVLD